MLKCLKNITKSEFNYIKNHEITIYEKLDMFYFNVLLTENNTTILKSNHHIIDKIDRIVNSTYSTINDFVESNINTNKKEIINKFGECIIGFFYCPVEKPVNIDYSSSHLVNKFILGNIKSLLDNKKIEENGYLDIEYFKSDKYQVFPYPEFGFIGKLESDTYGKKLFESYINNEISDQEFIKFICDPSTLYLNTDPYLDKRTYSGLNPNEIEGIILKTDKFSFQVLNNYDNSQFESKVDYYDRLLKDFINWYVFSNISIDITKDYIDSVSQIFIEYVNNSNFLKNYRYDANTLSPSINSYIADLDYSLINNDMVKVICKYNELYKNIYRILIHNLRYKKSPKESKFLKENDFKLWNELVDKINQIF